MSFNAKKRSRPIEEDIDDHLDLSSDSEIDSGEAILEINDPFKGIDGHVKDYRSLIFKPDFHLRPLSIGTNGKIYFETCNEHYKLIEDFLIAIADPVSRSGLFHVYKLTDTSLYAAVSSGMKNEDILRYLNKLCKYNVPDNIVSFIKLSTANYGKASLVLRHGKLQIESHSLDHLKKLTENSKIRQCLIKDESGFIKIPEESTNESRVISNPFANDINDSNLAADIVEFYQNIEKEDEELGYTENSLNLLKKGKIVYSIDIKEDKMEQIKKCCIEIRSTLLTEYDFQHDGANPDIAMDLKPTTCLRPYQEKSLRKMFGNSRARSGIIVLPCGAGKTLVGVTAACTIRKKCIVFCTGGVAVEQWKQTFLHYTTIEEKRICRFTGSNKDPFKNTDIFVTTYNIIGYSGKRSYETEKTMEWIKTQEWGLILLDEVHTIPAKTFRSVLGVIHGHCMLGLTATLVREDDKINDLNFLVGPKLYEANWMELQDKGFIARIQCVEVQCPMTPEFYEKYLETTPKKQMLLYLMNPEKIRRCQFLIKKHEERKDKIIVFSDNLFTLREYAKLMKRPYLEGDTSHEERMQVMNVFKTTDRVNTIFVSKMADVALDLPEATVLIQISSQGASRRQEAQRLGRITRAKKGMRPDEINGYFYSLVSTETQEHIFCHKRQKFLTDQGYSYKVVRAFPDMDKETLFYSTKKEQIELLTKVLAADESQHELEGNNLKKEKRVKKVKNNDAMYSTMQEKLRILNNSIKK